MIELIGQTLIANSYNVIPVVTGEKRPAIARWQHARLGPADCAQYAGCGVGVLTGVEFLARGALCALDVDTSDVGLAEWFEAWCLARFGVCAVRVGASPKRLLVYRAAVEGWSKVASAWLRGADGSKHRLEVLGAGQQFVAYGRHPTGVEYEWTDIWGGLEVLRCGELALLSLDDVRAAVEAFEREAERRGLTLDAQPGHRPNTSTEVDRAGGEGGESPRDLMENYAPPLGLSIGEVRDLLKFAGDPSDYEAWLQLGMALHHETGGAGGPGEWFQLWEDWSCAADNYAGIEDLAHRWGGFGHTVAAGARPMTLKYLVKAASEATVDARGAAGATEYPRTEAGNAARLVDRFGRDLLWCAELGCWYRWSGKHWRPVHLTEVRCLAKRVVEDMRADIVLCSTDREKSDLMKWCAASQRWTMYDHMVSIASLSEALWVRAAELDGDKRYLGVQNGVVDLWNGMLLPPDRRWRVTRLATGEYYADAQCPLFEATLREVFEGDSELPGFFWRLCGYSITGDPREHLLVLPFGGGGNGKGTLLNAIQYALGAHATTGHASSFVREDGSGGGSGAARPDLIALAGVRFVLVSEPPKGAELREDVIKAMAGGDVLPARALYSGVMIQIQPSWTVWISTNHKPVIKGEDNGIWRRVLPVPFLRSFDGDPTKDVTRPARLREEAEGILAWLVRGAVEYRRTGLCVPSAVSASRAEYKADMDLLGDWLAERCVLGAGAAVSLDALWLDWEAWAKVRGELRFVASRKNLSKKLQAKGFFRERTMTGAQILGLKLQNTAISDA